jgi:hypothetical protein
MVAKIPRINSDTASTMRRPHSKEVRVEEAATALADPSAGIRKLRSPRKRNIGDG